MKKKETIINRMLNILAEANDLDSDIVDHKTFYKAHLHAIDVLECCEESEDGEFDIFKFICKLGDRYFGFYDKLKPILIAEGLTTMEQRIAFNDKTFVLEEE